MFTIHLAVIVIAFQYVKLRPEDAWLVSYVLRSSSKEQLVFASGPLVSYALSPE